MLCHINEVLLLRHNTGKNASSNLIHSHDHVTSIFLIEFQECNSQDEYLNSSAYVDTVLYVQKVIPITI